MTFSARVIARNVQVSEWDSWHVAHSCDFLIHHCNLARESRARAASVPAQVSAEHALAEAEITETACAMAGSAPCLPVAVDRYPGGHCVSLRAMAWRRHEILGPRRSRCRAAWSHAALCATPRAALRSLAPRVLRQAEAALALRQACGSPGHPERLLRAGQLGEPACRSLDYSTKVTAAQRLGDAPLREEHRWWLQLPAVLGAMVSQFIGWGTRPRRAC